MKHRLGTVLLGERPVWWLGVALLIAGLLLPWLILAWRAAERPLLRDTQGPVTLRPEMVALPAGRFIMGSPADEAGRDDDEREHEVLISQPFVISRTEVTQGQFAAVMGEGAWSRRQDFWGRSCEDAGVDKNLPVVCVSWFEAVAFCNRLSELEGLTPAYTVQGRDVQWRPDRNPNGYRLLTEAEWEYAARAGTRTTWVGTDSESDVCRYGNVADETYKADHPDSITFPCSDDYSRLAPATAKEVNGWHLHGFGGNAAEWVWDWYGEYVQEEAAVPDPLGPDGGSDRVIRGGSWRIVPRVARVAIRNGSAPGDRNVSVGFRLARSCPSANSPSGCLPR